MKAVHEASKRHMRFILSLTILLMMVIILMFLNINMGSVSVSFSEIFKIFAGLDDTGMAHDIIWKIRLPRMFAAFILGGGLALSGFLLQTYFNNPIAGPYVLGISSGSKLVVAIVMVTAMSRHYTLNSAMLITAAFIGAMITMSFVLLVARRVKRSSVLIVSGVMIAYICSAITDFIVTFADDASIVNLHNWSIGSFSGTTWEDVKLMAWVILITSLLVFFLSKPISAYQMGENYAQNMGLNIKIFRLVLVILSSVLCASVIAFAGPISFVGIAVPHLVKALLKTSKPILVIPVCFLGGAIFCMGCDLIARTTFSPVEMSLSSVTALFGAPVVIGIMLKKKAR